VTLADGAFLGMRAVVLQTLPSRRRVRILLEILGRPTPIEVDLNSIALEKKPIAELVTSLAVPGLVPH